MVWGQEPGADPRRLFGEAAALVLNGATGWAEPFQKQAGQHVVAVHRVLGQGLGPRGGQGILVQL